MRVRATMKDVAALSGVSLKTVSRVVNGEPGDSEDLTLRVQNAVTQLDYRHNLAAVRASLSKGAFTSASEEGHAMTIEQAAIYALAQGNA